LSVKFLLVIASKVILGFVLSGSMTIFFFSRLLHVFKWGHLFNDRRGLTATGYSFTTGDDSTLLQGPQAPYTRV
jgi:hypothetical protein